MAVEERASYLQSVVDGSRSVTVVIGLDGVIRYASAGIEDLLGLSPTEAVGRSILGWLRPEELERAARAIALTEEVGPMRYFPMTFGIHRSDGTSAEVDVLAANHLNHAALGGIVLSLCNAEERTQYVEPVRALAKGASHDRVLDLIASGLGRGGAALRPAFIAYDPGPDGVGYRKLHAVRAPATLVEVMRGFLGGTRASDWVDLDDRQLVSASADELPPTLRSCLETTGYHGIRLGAIAVSGVVAGLLVSAETASLWQAGGWSPAMEAHWRQLLDLATVAFERKRDRARLLHAATHDPLTGLANRLLFFRRLERMVQRADATVLYLDLDGFKAVNDRHGHASGDELLVEVGRRVSETVRPGDLVARLGGDEFAVAISGGGLDLAVDLAARLVSAVSAPLPGSAFSETIGVSIGVAHWRPHQTAEELVNEADRALLAAKHDHRGGVVVHA